MAYEPLAGIRILDFTWVLAGPASTQLLAMLGAEVIKVESRARLDGYRRGMAQQEGGSGSLNLSPPFNDVNCPKRGITLNLTNPEGLALARKLVAVSDVVTDNFTPGTMDKRGLGYPTLRAIKPDIIVLSSSAAGSIGPERGNAGYAPIFAAYGGLSHVTGYPDSPPTDILRPLDMRVGLHSALAVLLALNHRSRTGKGQYIDLSSQEVASIYLGEMLLDRAITGRDSFRHANRDRTMAPHNCYPCQGNDSWVSIAVATEVEWQALVAAIGDPRLRDEQFADTHRRWLHQEELDALIGEWTQKYTPYEITHTLQKRGVAAFPTMTSEQIRTDPHLQERQLLTRVEHPEAGRYLVSNLPWKFSESTLPITKAAPQLGQDNNYAFGELLGMDHAEVVALQEQQAIY